MKIHVFLTHPHVACWNFQDRHRDRLQAAFPDSRVVPFLHSRDFLAELEQADVAVVWYFKREWLADAPDLKLISTPAAGRDWIDLPGEDAGGNLPAVWHGGFHGSMMAESVVGAALHFVKAFAFSAEMQKKRKWARIKVSEKIESLYRTRVTVLGFGRIGQAIGAAFKTFGSCVTGVRRTAATPPTWFEAGDQIATPDDLQALLPQTDHLVLALPGGAETDGLLTRELLDLLNGSVCFYNVGRGNPYREEDLVRALTHGKIRHAYLDVFDTEPLPEESPLWDIDKVLIQPHLSAASPQYLDLYVEELIERLRKERFGAAG